MSCPRAAWSTAHKLMITSSHQAQILTDRVLPLLAKVEPRPPTNLSRQGGAPACPDFEHVYRAALLGMRIRKPIFVAYDHLQGDAATDDDDENDNPSCWDSQTEPSSTEEPFWLEDAHPFDQVGELPTGARLAKIQDKKTGRVKDWRERDKQ